MDLPGNERRARYLRHSSRDPYKPNFILASSIRNRVSVYVMSDPVLRQWKDCVFDIGVELNSLLLRSPSLRATHLLNHDMMANTTLLGDGATSAASSSYAHPERIILHGNAIGIVPYTPPQVYMVRLRLKLPLVKYENGSATCHFASNISYVILEQTMVLPQITQYISRCFTDAIEALSMGSTLDDSLDLVPSQSHSHSHDLWHDEHSILNNTFNSEGGLEINPDMSNIVGTRKVLPADDDDEEGSCTAYKKSPLDTRSTLFTGVSVSCDTEAASGSAAERNERSSMTQPSSSSSNTVFSNTDTYVLLQNLTSAIRTDPLLASVNTPAASRDHTDFPHFKSCDHAESRDYTDSSHSKSCDYAESPRSTSSPLEIKTPNLDNTFSSNGDSRDRQTAELSELEDQLCTDFEQTLLLSPNGDHFKNRPIPELLGSPLQVDTCHGYFDSMNMSLPSSLQYPLGVLSPTKRAFLARRQQDDNEDLEYAFRDKSDQVPQFIRRDKKFKYIKVGKVQKFVSLFEEQRGQA